MIFDIHCHILPNVDDGAKDGKTTKRMLQRAVEEGIDAIVATPHYSCEMEDQETEEIKQKFLTIQKWWKEKEPDKELYLGSELYYSEGLIAALERGAALTMNGTRYILVEFPIYLNFQNIKKAVQKLLYAGYIPIIAHVERYERMKKLELVSELVDMGALIQVNVSAVIGRNGFKDRFYVMKLIKKHVVHFVGTDAHDTEVRKIRMKACMQYLEKKLGKEKAAQILEENPRRMLEGEELNG